MSSFSLINSHPLMPTTWFLLKNLLYIWAPPLPLQKSPSELSERLPLRPEVLRILNLQAVHFFFFSIKAYNTSGPCYQGSGVRKCLPYTLHPFLHHPLSTNDAETFPGSLHAQSSSSLPFTFVKRRCSSCTKPMWCDLL